MEFRKRRPQLTGQVHDEVVLTVKKGYREEVIKLLKEAIAVVNEELKLNRELDVDVQFGQSYADIH
ncbi:DNA polymerase I [compost metagenome]